MKKLLLIGLILAILLLAMPQGVLAAPGDPIKTATVSGTIESSLDLVITAQPGATPWVMTAGLQPLGFDNVYATQHSGTKALSFAVDTNHKWEVRTTATDAGKMKAAVTLTDPMFITIESGVPTSLATANLLIWDGAQTEIGVTPFSSDLSQKVYTTDPQGNYAITITFTAANIP